MSEEYVDQPAVAPKRNGMRERLLAIPEGKAIVIRDEIERRKTAHALAGAQDRKIYKVRSRSQPDGSFIVWVEKRDQGIA